MTATPLPNRFSRRTATGGAATLLLAVSQGQAFAQATPGISAEANLFSLSGDGVDIVYSTSSITGQPQFSYTDANMDIRAEGEEIDVQPAAASGGWALGTLVSVFLDATPDAWARTVTLILPDINLIDGEETTFSTFAILTTNQSHIGGPTFVQGQIQSYEVIPLDGSANAVVF